MSSHVVYTCLPMWCKHVFPCGVHMYSHVVYTCITICCYVVQMNNYMLLCCTHLELNLGTCINICCSHV